METKFNSKIIADGRVTLPKKLREENGLKEGDIVELTFSKKLSEEG